MKQKSRVQIKAEETTEIVGAWLLILIVIAGAFLCTALAFWAVTGLVDYAVSPFN